MVALSDLVSNIYLTNQLEIGEHRAIRYYSRLINFLRVNSITVSFLGVFLRYMSKLVHIIQWELSSPEQPKPLCIDVCEVHRMKGNYAVLPITRHI